MNRRQNMFTNFSDYGDQKHDANPLFAPGLGNQTSVLNSNVKIRLAFLKKVYSILTVQLTLTSIISAIIIMVPTLQHFLTANLWILIINLVANIGTTFVLLAKRNEYPMNFYLLAAFVSDYVFRHILYILCIYFLNLFQTFLNSISIGSASIKKSNINLKNKIYINIFYLKVSLYDLDLVLQAVFLTTCIVVGLTLYCFFGKSDFTWLTSILLSLITICFIGGLMNVRNIFKSSFQNKQFKIIKICFIF